MMVRFSSAQQEIANLDIEMVPDPATNSITIEVKVPPELSYAAQEYVNMMAEVAQDIIRRNTEVE